MAHASSAPVLVFDQQLGVSGRLLVARQNQSPLIDGTNPSSIILISPNFPSTAAGVNAGASEAMRLLDDAEVTMDLCRLFSIVAESGDRSTRLNRQNYGQNAKNYLQL